MTEQSEQSKVGGDAAQAKLLRNKKKAFMAVAAAIALVAGGSWAVKEARGGDTGLAKKVSQQFPNTKISSTNCDIGVSGLCEVVAGPNVFYVTKDAKHAFVGALVDLDKKVDLTDKRLRELAAVNNVEGRIAGQPSPGGQAAGAAQPAGRPSAPAAKLNVTLPRDNAIVHNPGAPIKLTIFTDLNCGYCHKLWEDLKTATDIEVTEYPVAFLAADSRDKAKLALCAPDRVKAVAAIYGGGELTAPGDCTSADKAVMANTDFAQKHDITGTPTLVRADGARISGWKPLAEVRSFAKGA